MRHLADLPNKPLAIFITGAWLSFSVGCTPHTYYEPQPGPEQETRLLDPANRLNQVDVLFVIDNSGSMAEEQQNLRDNFPVFMEELKRLQGGLPDVHIGVVSSDMGAGIGTDRGCDGSGGDRAEFRPPDNCGLDEGARFLISNDDGMRNNFAGDISEVFSCVADLGATGCGFEHQLLAVRYALDESLTPNNNGFLRPNSLLAIVIVTDEDDCSAPRDADLFADIERFPGDQFESLRCGLIGHQCDGAALTPNTFMTSLDNCSATEDGGDGLISVQRITDFVKGLRPNAENRLVVSTIMGWPEDATTSTYGIHERDGRLDLMPVCTRGEESSAAPGLRLKSFVDAFGDNGITESICQNDYAPALRRLGELILDELETGCFTDALVDADGDGFNDVFVPECQVVDRVPDPVTGIFQDFLLPKCEASDAPELSDNKPCYAALDQAQQADINRDASDIEGPSCRLGSGWQVRIFREADAPDGTFQSITCRTCANTDPDSRLVRQGLCRNAF